MRPEEIIVDFITFNSAALNDISNESPELSESVSNVIATLTETFTDAKVIPTVPKDDSKDDNSIKLYVFNLNTSFANVRKVNPAFTNVFDNWWFDNAKYVALYKDFMVDDVELYLYDTSNKLVDRIKLPATEYEDFIVHNDDVSVYALDEKPKRDAGRLYIPSKRSWSYTDVDDSKDYSGLQINQKPKFADYKFTENKGDRKGPSMSAGYLKKKYNNDDAHTEELLNYLAFTGNDGSWYRINVSAKGTWSWKVLRAYRPANPMTLDEYESEDYADAKSTDISSLNRDELQALLIEKKEVLESGVFVENVDPEYTELEMEIDEIESELNK